VGRITRAHGIHGEVSVLVLSEVESRFADGSVLRSEGGVTLTVDSSRSHRGRLLVKFREIGDRTAAEAVQGQYLFVTTAELPELPSESFWPHELQGCDVVTENGRSLGRIDDVIHGEANDIWVTHRDGEETLVPALKDVIVSVDVAAKRVVVRELPGLTERGTTGAR
jgi:16S rRNA processing protein RimM